MSFNKKIALVTGGSRGIGFGVAKALYEQGAYVIITARDFTKVKEAAKSIDPTGTKVIPKAVDVRNFESVKKLIGEIESEYEALHYLVNNAGITGPHQVGISDYSIEDWQQIMDTNINGTFYMMKYALPLIERNAGGSVVNLSSANGFVGIAGIAPYTATKHAIIGLTKSVALEYAQRNVRINAIAPGYVATENIKSLPTEIQQWMALQHPMQRLASVSEVVNTILFLLSPSSSFTTGSVYVVDGGYLAQ